MSSAGRTRTPRTPRTPRPFGRQRKQVDEDKLAALLDKGVTWADAAKILGCSVATIARRLRDPSPPPLAAHGPALAPAHAPLPEPPPMDAEARRRAALAALDRALASDDARAVQAAKEVLAESRREASLDEYATAQHAQGRAATRLAARSLGRAIRARLASVDDPELADAYRRAASLQAAPEDVDALTDLLMTPARAEVLHAV